MPEERSLSGTSCIVRGATISCGNACSEIYKKKNVFLYFYMKYHET